MSDDVAECERCGRTAGGRRQLMFYRRLMPGPRVQRQFFCHRCRRIMRVYAAIGLSLLGAVVGCLAVFTFWASSH